MDSKAEPRIAQSGNLNELEEPRSDEWAVREAELVSEQVEPDQPIMGELRDIPHSFDFPEISFELLEYLGGSSILAGVNLTQHVADGSLWSLEKKSVAPLSIGQTTVASGLQLDIVSPESCEELVTHRDLGNEPLRKPLSIAERRCSV